MTPDQRGQFGPEEIDEVVSEEFEASVPSDPFQGAPGQPQNPYTQNQVPYQQAPGYPQGPYAQTQSPYQDAPGSQYPYVPGAVPAVWSPKSKLAAGLLGIFLGAFGVHNFYLGFTGKAVAQLLITVLSFGFLSPVSGLWGLIEGILVLASKTGTQWDLDGQGLPMLPIGD